jgi:WD40 repeat protein
MILIETGTPKPITSLQFSPDGLALTSCGDSVSDWTGYGTRENWAQAPAAVTTLTAWSPTGKRRAVVLGVHIFESPRENIFKPGNDQLFTMPMTPNLRTIFQATCLSYMSDELLLIGSGHAYEADTGILMIWDTQTRKARPHRIEEKDGVRVIATHPPSKLVAWGTGQSRMRFMYLDKPDKVDIPLTKTTNAIAFSPDGLTLAAVVDWNIMTYNITRKQPVHSLQGHKGRVTGLCFSPDGRSVVTGSWDETVRVWDPESGRERQCYRWGLGKITSIAYAPDGTRIAAGTAAGQIAIWDVD